MNNLVKKIEVPPIMINDLGMIELQNEVKNKIAEAIYNLLDEEVSEYSGHKETLLSNCIEFASDTLEITPWMGDGDRIFIRITFEMMLARTNRRSRTTELLFDRSSTFLITDGDFEVGYFNIRPNE